MKLKIHPEYAGLCGSCRYASLAKTINGHFLARCDWFGWSVLEPCVITEAVRRSIYEFSAINIPRKLWHNRPYAKSG